MKTKKIKEFTTRRGYKIYVLERIENTMLNYFCEEDVMYDVLYIDGKKKVLTRRGLRNAIRFN